MAIVLYHHPYSRAANVLWMLEELGQPYELHYVDIMKGEQKKPPVVELNPIGKLPVLTDGDAVVSEQAAIGIYLADRYSLGTLAPKLDDPDRGAYLRWSFFAPSVIEPGLLARSQGWQFKASQAGWGSYEEMVSAMESAIGGRDYVLGSGFSMADCIFGGTVRFMVTFKMLEPTPALAAYKARLDERPAARRANEKNQQIAEDRGLVR